MYKSLFLKKSIFVFISLVFLSNSIKAESSVVIRPQVGYGIIKLSNSGNEPTSHIGIRALLNASKSQKYGLEATQFSFKNSKFDKRTKMYAVGIVLERYPTDTFLMSIGTIGYFNYGKSGNPVGLMSNLGWKPKVHKSIKPSLSYRSDVIFNQGDLDIIQSISLGIDF